MRATARDVPYYVCGHNLHPLLFHCRRRTLLVTFVVNYRNRNAIIDKNARIGVGCRLVNEAGVEHSDEHAARGIYIRDGIIVVAKSAAVPDGTHV